MSLTDLFNLVLLFVFLLGAGLFSGAEVAMFSLSPADLEDIKEEKTESSKMLIYHKNHPRKLLALLLYEYCYVVCRNIWVKFYFC